MTSMVNGLTSMVGVVVVMHICANQTINFSAPTFPQWLAKNTTRSINVRAAVNNSLLTRDEADEMLPRIIRHNADVGNTLPGMCRMKPMEAFRCDMSVVQERRRKRKLEEEDEQKRQDAHMKRRQTQIDRAVSVTLRTVGADSPLVQFSKQHGLAVVKVDATTYTVRDGSSDHRFELGYRPSAEVRARMHAMADFDRFVIWFVGDDKEIQYHSVDRATVYRNIQQKINSYKGHDRKRKFQECDLTPEDVLEMYMTQAGCCAICSEFVDETRISVDAINSQNGHIKSNCQVLCFKCNSAKR